MADKAWKAFERRCARFFGAERNPLSGTNSRHSASDSLSPIFFIEAKLRQRFAHHEVLRSAKELAKKEGKIPVLATQKYNEKTFCVTVDKDDLENFCKALLKSRGYSILRRTD